MNYGGGGGEGGGGERGGGGGRTQEQRECPFSILNTYPVQHFYHSTIYDFNIVALIIMTS